MFISSFAQSRRGRSMPAILAAAFLITQCMNVCADGWHNAALVTSSLDQWLDQSLGELKRTIPDLDKKLKSSEIKAVTNLQELKDKANQAKPAPNQPKTATPPARGKLQNQLTPQQQQLLAQKSRDCMEILACMNPENIIPSEFPMFQLQQIPKYREAAKNMLKLMGPAGGAAVTNQLRAELMGMSPAAGLVPHNNYYADLLELLRDSAVEGNLSERDIADLHQATAGQKNGPAAGLAKEVEKTLADLANLDILVLLEWAEQATDRTRKQSLLNKVRQKLGEANVAELVQVLGSGADKTVKDAASKELEKRWTTAGVLELLKVLDTVEDAKVQQTAAAELENRSPKFADVKDDLLQIWKFAQSQNPRIAQAAKSHVENAFLRAPISACLEFLSGGDATLNKLVWAQLDDRIARADAERKAGYRDSAIAILTDNSARPATRQASLDLLARLKDREAIGPLIEVLPQLPRDLSPKAGSLLKDLTGQNFGPRPGDGVAELGVAAKRWREWWKQNGGK